MQPVYQVFILDIKFRFTCDESDLFYNFLKFQNIMTRIVGVTHTLVIFVFM